MADSKKYDGSQWEHSLRKLTTATDTLTTLPADLYADGTNATATIKGNLSQSGTPTPSSPIYPSEVGNKTANLWNPNQTITQGYYNDSGTLVDDLTTGHSELMSIGGNSTFTINNLWYNEELKPNFAVYEWDSNKQFLRRTNRQYPTDNPITFTTGNDAVYISFQFKLNWNSNGVMLNTGSTALPYEPYGIKIPISSGGVTTPVYLGEVQTTRKIKKLVLTGQEGWTVETGKTYVLEGVEQTQTGYTDAICSHYALATSYNAVMTINNTFSLSKRPALFIHDDNYSSTTNFKTYLQQQYANGTPVTVWYVLAESTTTTLNEPIRKIGNYADTVSGIVIPTITGKDTFDVETTLKPSEVSLTYTGWHDSSAKEWDGSQWGLTE